MSSGRVASFSFDRECPLADPILENYPWAASCFDLHPLPLFSTAYRSVGCFEQHEGVRLESANVV